MGKNISEKDLLSSSATRPPIDTSMPARYCLKLTEVRSSSGSKDVLKNKIQGNQIRDNQLAKKYSHIPEHDHGERMSPCVRALLHLYREQQGHAHPAIPVGNNAKDKIV